MEKTVERKENGFANPKRAFEMYADMVYRLGFVRTRSINDSEDILQEVFLRYMKIWKRIESEEHLKASLIRITINCTNSLLGSAWFRKTEPLGEYVPYATYQNRTDVLGEVLKLPVKYRTVIHLHYYMGYSVGEIAELLKSKPSTVKTQLKRGRDMLKDILKEENYDF